MQQASTGALKITFGHLSERMSIQPQPASILTHCRRSAWSTDTMVKFTTRRADRRLQVLRWTGDDDCPPGVMDGLSYKMTAIALHSRRLVAVPEKTGRS